MESPEVLRLLDCLRDETRLSGGATFDLEDERDAGVDFFEPRGLGILFKLLFEEGGRVDDLVDVRVARGVTRGVSVSFVKGLGEPAGVTDKRGVLRRDERLGGFIFRSGFVDGRA